MTSARGREMLTYLPWYYQGSSVMQAILEASGAEFDALRAALDGVLDQAFVVRASWSLDRWESELGLPPVLGWTDQQRRERILSKLRGFGTATIARIKAYAETFEYGTVSVSEDVLGFALYIRFVDTRGIPAKMAEFQAAIREIVPAHLDITFLFTYFIWDEWDAMNTTWDAWDARAVTWDAMPTFSPS